MAQIIKELVTKWTYKVDSSQVKAAIKQVRSLKKNIVDVKMHSSKFAKGEVNKVNRIRTAWRGLNKSVRNYRGEVAKSNAGMGGFKTFAAARALGLGAGPAAGLAAGGGIAALSGVGAALRAGMGEEVAQVEYEGFLKSADKARSMLKDLAEFGSKTPFEIPQLEDLGIQLLAGGFAAKEIIPTLGRLGDVTGGSADKLNRMLINLIQIRANNRAYTQDLKQFAMAGIPIFQQLQKQLKKSGTEIRKMAKDGQISFKIINDALIQMTSNGGMFEGRMVSISKTLRGRLSNLNDAFFRLGRALVRSVLPFLSSVTFSFSNFIEVFAQGVELVNEFGSGLRWLGRGLFLSILTWTGPVGIAITGIYLLIDDLIALFQGRKSVIGTFFSFLRDLVYDFIDGAFIRIQNLIQNLKPLLDSVAAVGTTVGIAANLVSGNTVQAANDALKLFGIGNITVKQDNHVGLRGGESTDGTFEMLSKLNKDAHRTALEILRSPMEQ